MLSFLALKINSSLSNIWSQSQYHSQHFCYSGILLLVSTLSAVKMLKTTPKSQCINPVNLLLRQTTATGRELSSCSHSAVSAPCVSGSHLISMPLKAVLVLKTEREEQCRRLSGARSGFAFARISLATTHLYAFDLIQAGWATQLIFVHWAKKGEWSLSRGESRHFCKGTLEYVSR